MVMINIGIPEGILNTIVERRHFHKNRPVGSQGYIRVNFNALIGFPGCVKPYKEYNVSVFINFEKQVPTPCSFKGTFWGY